MTVDASVLEGTIERFVLARRWINIAGRALLVLLTMALLALIVQSGSIEPAIMTGDLIVTRIAATATAEVGDVVMFEDPTREGELVSHRATRITPGEKRFAFVTKGDANTGVERWRIRADGTLGVVKARIPKVGYALAWSTIPQIRIGMLFTACLILLVVALRRIWSS